ncbi:TPA: ribosome recycling factor [Candidatus Galligastranaerophilus intestinavium]|uniref:Ribosome-recycling factor n=1 Tax=Candidatus Galligastranaerophilus intestinavium TaxID=2840836 RepID=A0A9D1JXG2_9BACT|nr:ribosome recycling factor [Candidatus Galligastranaerophilus intestinavium]
MSVDEIKNSGKDKMEKCVAQLKKELATVRTGRANPLILDKITVDYYGAPTPLRQMAQVSVSEGTTLVITPFDKTIIKEIEKAIVKAELGIAPNSDGVVVRLTFPPLTQDRRKQLSKDVKAMGENAKVAIRNVRRDMTDEVKKLEKSENMPEDAVKDAQNEVQKLTDKYIGIVDEVVIEKEKEVLTV